jgi:hypothetical protein
MRNLDPDFPASLGEEAEERQAGHRLNVTAMHSADATLRDRRADDPIDASRINILIEPSASLALRSSNAGV